MRIRLSQLRRLIRETVEQVKQEMDEADLETEADQDLDEADDLAQWTSSYARTGAGGTVHGDSWDEPESKPSYTNSYKTPEEKERERRDYEYRHRYDKEDDDRMMRGGG